jgi:hypothetical protein
VTTDKSDARWARKAMAIDWGPERDGRLGRCAIKHFVL